MMPRDWSPWLALALLLAAGGAFPAELRPFDSGSMAAIRAAQAGKPFVLAFWSVHCPPCREELAHWGAWSRRHPGVHILLVATDDPGERELAAAALARHDLDRVETWAFADAYAERLRWSVDPKWRGELPRTYFYDAGHRAEARSGRVDTAWVEAWLAKQGAGR
jgi:thiol-disulfide isomerase/thioredoxin